MASHVVASHVVSRDIVDGHCLAGTVVRMRRIRWRYVTRDARDQADFARYRRGADGNRQRECHEPMQHPVHTVTRFHDR